MLKASFSPNLCVGFLFLILYPGLSSSSSSPPPPPPPPHHTTTLSHTTLSHAFFHTSLCYMSCHTSFTHTLLHTILSHKIFHTHFVTQQLCHTQLCHTHPPSFHVAGVALGDMYLRFAWQRGTYGTGLALVARLDWD